MSVVFVVAAGWQISKQMHIMFRIRENEGGGGGGAPNAQRKRQVL